MRETWQTQIGAMVLIVSVIAMTGTGAVATATVTEQEQCEFPVSAVDATGTEVTIDAEPERVTTLSPSAAQTMWEIGAREKVVGVTKYATYLDGAGAKTNISGGGFTAVVPEKVVATEPDLVLAPSVISNETVETLREKGLTVYKFRFEGTLESVKEQTLLTGELVGACEGAEETVEWMEGQLATVREAVGTVEPVRALYEFSGGWTAGNGTFIHEMITTAGAVNVAADVGITGFSTISEETIANTTVEWLIQTSLSPEPPRSDVYNETVAVEEGNIVVLNTNYLNQPAPRVVLPIVKLAKTFHPDAYSEANSTDTPTSETQESVTPSPRPLNTETTTPTSTTESSPGMTVVIAMVALALFGLLIPRDP